MHNAKEDQVYESFKQFVLPFNIVLLRLFERLFLNRNPEDLGHKGIAQRAQRVNY